MSVVLSEHLPLLASAPEGIQKLRELVLRLAIEGRITDSDTSGWTQTTLGDVGDWGSGGTPLKAHTDYYGGTIPWLVIGDLNDGLVTAAETHITEKGLANSSAKLVPAGTLLIAMYGSIGKLGIAGIECATNQAIAHCKVNSAIAECHFLFYFVRAIRGQLLSSGQGLAQQNISQKLLKATPIQLPPLSEQRRIVAKVDELMALCDQLEAEQSDAASAHARLVETLLGMLTQSTDAADLAANWQRLAEHFDTLFATEASIDALKQTVLQLAVMGKLVPQDTHDEPVNESLVEISLIEASNPSRLAENEAGAQVTLTLPSGWRWSSVERLTKSGQTTTYGILKPVWVNGGVPTVRVSEMKTGTIDIDNLPTCDPERASSFQKTKLQAHDLLISKDGTIGKTAFVPPELAGGNITQHVLRFPITEQVNRLYIRIAIDAPACQAWMVGETKGVALKGVNVGDFRRMPIPLPPLREQHRIVAKVDELMALCDRLKADLASARQHQALLADTLIDAALEVA